MTKKEDALSHARLLEVMDYDPLTGVFMWRFQRGPKVRKNLVAGGLSDRTSGYTVIGIDNHVYKAHRLAWFYVHGTWPKNHIDHINRKAWDNRIANLRDVPPGGNAANKIRTRKKGEWSGVEYREWAKNPYRTRICVEGKNIGLGCYPTGEEAHAAYLAAKVKYHGFPA